MPSYEEKLNGFAEGKRLVRLSRSVRDRADATCDACGSTQPRTLFALKDEDTGRCYFVGDNCLKELVKRGAILKRFGRDSGPAAYEAEMHRRTQELQKEGITEQKGEAGKGRATRDAETPSSNGKQSTPAANGNPSAVATGVSYLFPTLLVTEASEDYKAVVCLHTADGTIRSWGCAREIRYEYVWRRGGYKDTVLEQVKRELPDALGICIARAWKQACSRIAESEVSIQHLRGPDGMHQDQSYSSDTIGTDGPVEISRMGASPRNGGVTTHSADLRTES